jgi:hypothetical protein
MKPAPGTLDFCGATLVEVHNPHINVGCGCSMSSIGLSRTHATRLVLRAIHRLSCYFLLALASAAAQEVTGTIIGRVVDPQGAAVVNATVTLIHEDRNAIVRIVSTDETGTYSAPLLPIGTYTVVARAPGFKGTVRRPFGVNVNDRITTDFQLELGSVTQEIIVHENFDPVETTPVIGGLISERQVRELPLNNRVYEQLVTLVPGVSSGVSDQLYVGTTNPTGQTNTVNFSINGNRGSQNYWTIDGADNVDRGSNTTVLNYPSVEAIAEFKVVRAAFDAEFGRAGGGHVSVVTRSGGQMFHGSIFEFLRNDILAANDFFNRRKQIPRPAIRYNNFGWTLGGPIFMPGRFNPQKTSTFFFFSQEFRRAITHTTVRALVPTASEKAGKFSVPVCVAFVGGTCAESATEIPNINPVAAQYIQDIWSKIPEPDDPNTHQLFSAMRNVANHRQELLRIDHVFSPRLSIFGRYLQDSIPTIEPTGAFTASVLPGVATTDTNSPGRNAVVRATWILTPAWFLDLGYSYSYGAIFSEPIGLIASENSPHVNVVLPFPSTLNRVPSLQFNDAVSNVRGFGPYRDYNRDHNISANASVAAGKHNFKFGVSYHRYQKTENTANNNAGVFTFDNTGVPDPDPGDPQLNFAQTWANFLLGNAATFQQTSEDITPDIRSNQVEIFAQDNFRVRPNILISYGLRYSLFRQPFDANGKLTNFDPASYNPAAAPAIDEQGSIIPGTGDLLNGIVGPGVNPKFANKVSNENNRNFAPRVGLSWNPFGNGSTAIRAGYGIFYDSILVGALEQSMGVNPPFVTNLVVPNVPLDDPAAATAIQTTPRSLRVTPQPSNTPYVQQWSLGVQRELSSGFLLDVTYCGSKGTHLLGIVDINQVPPGAAAAAGIGPIDSRNVSLLNPLRPYKGFAYIDALENWFNSNYNALQTRAERNLGNNGYVNVNYSWSHGLTDNQTDRNTAPQNRYDIQAEYGPTQLDRRHIFSADFLYELPWLSPQRGWLGHIAGGWGIAGMVSYNSGLPLTVIMRGADPAGLGIIGSTLVGARPDMTGDPNVAAPHTVEQWFDTSVFVPVPKGENRPGNSGRGVVRGPSIHRWDLAVIKNTQIGERVRLQFRAEAFNVWNHTNFQTVSTTFGSSDFGQVISARDPRIVQLGVKLSF